MQLQRFLREDMVDLDFEVELPPLAESGESEESEESGESGEEGEETLTGGRLWRHKENVLRRLVNLFDLSGQVGNPSKLLRDILNRERKASTALGKRVAIPHVRTSQAKRLIMAVAISHQGVEFDAVDGLPVNIFLATVGPPHDDKLYQKLYRQIATLVLEQEDFIDDLLEVTWPGEVIRLLNRWIG